MDTGSVLSEPVNYPAALRGFSKERSTSMTILSPKPRMSQLENLEAKMANIEVSLSSTTNASRRRKGLSLGGGASIINGTSSVSGRTSVRHNETKEFRSALQDREAVIQNLRIQLGLGKLPRPTGPPLDENEKRIAEHKLVQLKTDAENKRIAIRNLKTALEKLDITDNIDIRIRQAELEYALGREELQLLSIVEEARALQTRLEKSKPESNSLYSIISSGVSLSLHAVLATTGRWAACTKTEAAGLFVEWSLDGEGLSRGDRILEVNGKLVTCKTKEEFQKMIGTLDKCQLVILRKKSTVAHQQLLQQQQEDNQRLQHRISYLEEQVRELQTAKETSTNPPPLPSPSTHPSVSIANGKQNGKLMNGHHMNGHRSASDSASPSNSPSTPIKNMTNGHVTSINISLPANNVSEKNNIISERDNNGYVTTLLGGKAIQLHGLFSGKKSNNSSKSSQIAGIKSSTLSTQNGKTTLSAFTKHYNKNGSDHHHHITKTLIHDNCYHERLNGSHTDTEANYMPSRSGSKISINYIGSNSTGKKRFLRNGKLSSEVTNHEIHQQQQNIINGINHVNIHGNLHARSVEHLNFNGNDRRVNETLRPEEIRKFGDDLRSVRSLDFENNSTPQSTSKRNGTVNGGGDYGQTTELMVPRIRPTPPKKPLRLSLQRTQSLQTVELIPSNSDSEKKRSLKRAHINEKFNGEQQQLIENSTILHNSSLGKNKHI